MASLLERKKKQWAEERAFLAAAGINVFNKPGGTDSRKPSGSSERTANQPPPEETVQRLHQEQQRLSLQLQQQEMQHKHLDEEQRKKERLQREFEEHQSIRVDSEEVRLKQRQQMQQQQLLQQFHQQQQMQQQQMGHQSQMSSYAAPNYAIPLPPDYHANTLNGHQPYGAYGSQQYTNSPSPYHGQYPYQNYTGGSPYPDYGYPGPPQEVHKDPYGIQYHSEEPLDRYGQVSVSSGKADVLTVRGTPPSGVAFRWANNSSDSYGGKRRSTMDSGGSRARWGDHGVGVGHLWDPTQTPDKNRKDSLPPTWATQSMGNENGLPGGTLSTGQQSRQRSHARGGGMLSMNPEEADQKAIKQKRAEETQRIIQEQLEEKKRQKAEEEEREKREAAMWDERIKEQQRQQAKEYEEEIEKKRIKEEAATRKQAQLQEALKKAEESAKQEKYAKKAHLLNRKANRDQQENDHQTSFESSHNGLNLEEESNVKKKNKNQELDTKSKSNENQSEKKNKEEEEHHNSTVKVPASAPPSFANAHRPPKSPSTPTPDVIMARIQLLRALGLTPDYLVSTGLLDKNTLMSLLGAGYESQFLDIKSPGDMNLPIASPAISPMIAFGGGDLPQSATVQQPYVSGHTLTPRKYRSSFRECGTQYDIDAVSEDYSKTSSSSTSAADGAVKRRSQHKRSSSKDDKPPWNRYRSNRPYRKQTDKDPLVSKRLRKKHLTRSMSASGASTEESDVFSSAEIPPRRRRTWGDKKNKMVDSMSSDLSRPSSPNEDPPHSTMPQMREALKPNAALPPRPSNFVRRRNLRHKEEVKALSDRSTKSPNPSVDSNEDQKETSYSEENSHPAVNGATENSHRDGDSSSVRENSADEDQNDPSSQMRSESPPVPALNKGNEFNIPEYAPGEVAPTEPYKPKLSTPATKRKGNKLLIRNRKPVKPKQKTGEPVKSDERREDVKAIQRGETFDKQEENNSDGIDKSSSQIDLTLQSFQHSRSQSPPVPALQKRIQSASQVSYSSALPELPSSSSRPPSATSLKVTSQLKSSENMNESRTIGLDSDLPAIDGSTDFVSEKDSARGTDAAADHFNGSQPHALLNRRKEMPTPTLSDKNMLPTVDTDLNKQRTILPTDDHPNSWGTDIAIKKIQVGSRRESLASTDFYYSKGEGLSTPDYDTSLRLRSADYQTVQLGLKKPPSTPGSIISSGYESSSNSGYPDELLKTNHLNAVSRASSGCESVSER